MYVIFPAEDIVEATLSRVQHTNLQQQNQTPINYIGEQQEEYQHEIIDFGAIQQHRADELQQRSRNPSCKKKSTTKKKSEKSEIKMAAGGGGSGGNDVTLRDLHHPSLNEHLKNHNAVTFKLVRTVSDFTQQLSQTYEQHAEELQLLVSNFRKRNSELRKERPNCPSSLFHTWETLLQEVEIDSQAHSDVSVVLARQVSRPLLERSFHRKIQSRKVFTHRENFESLLNKAEDKLGKCRTDYKSSYLSYTSCPNSSAMANYLDAHNAYVQQLALTNAMLEQYHQETLPQLLQVTEGVQIVRNAATGRASEARGLLDQWAAYMQSHDLVTSLGDGSTLRSSVEEGRMQMKLKYDDDEDEEVEEADEEVVEGRSPVKHAVKHGIKKVVKKVKKSKLRKLIVPLVVIVMLKAITFIPLLIGLLGIKAWNALQLGFGSFLVSFGIAIYQLCTKLNLALHHNEHAAPVVAATPWGRAQDLAYAAHVQ